MREQRTNNNYFPIPDLENFKNIVKNRIAHKKATNLYSDKVSETVPDPFFVIKNLIWNKQDAFDFKDFSRDRVNILAFATLIHTRTFSYYLEKRNNYRFEFPKELIILPQLDIFKNEELIVLD